MVFWNSRALDMHAVEQSKGAATWQKLGWLKAYMEDDKPDVVFLGEVSGNLVQAQRLRRWWRREGYDMRMTPGSKGDATKPKNGIAVAVRHKTAVIEATRPLAEGVMGTKIRHREEGAARAMCYVHGLHGDTLAAVRQLEAAEGWIGEAGGGVMMGDFNHVPCVQWRRGNHQLNRPDQKIRELTGWSCACCGFGASAHRVIGGAYSGGGSGGIGGDVGWTRFDSERGSWGTPSARIDYGIAIGKEEGAWALREQVPAEQRNGDRTEVLSDHLLIGICRTIKKRARENERPQPVDLGIGKESTIRQALRSMKAGLGSAMRAARANTALGVSHYGRAVAALIGEAKKVGAAEKETERKAREKGATPRRSPTPKMRRQQWRARLRTAVMRQRRGDNPFACDDPVLFHWHISGLSRLRLWTRREGAAATWNAIVRRCRTEVRSAEKDAHAAQRAIDKEHAEKSRRLEAAAKGGTADAQTLKQMAWDMVCERKGGGKMEYVHEGDDPTRTKVSSTSPRFTSVLGEAGRRFVTGMDHGAVPAAFAAWCETFMQQHATLEGTRGGVWKLLEEVSWPRFRDAVARMPKKKSVGADGLSAELLQAAGTEVQKEVYNAIVADLTGGAVPGEWREVLYALLVKKPPNNPDVIADRREIALMSQGMKLFLQVVRHTAYRKVLGRVDKAQMGWLPGYGCIDPALTAASVIQAARRTGRSLWILYVDMAQFFPSINRQSLTVAELLHGLPEDVIRITALIYGESGVEADGIRCRYDSAAGLGAPFNNYMGALMGCVLSPDRAKILLNTVVVAVALHARGVRLYGQRPEAEEVRRVLHAAFADDYVAMFESEVQLRIAWSIWTAWEVASGCKLGMKEGALKTVVTGVWWKEGKAQEIQDPVLRTAEGNKVQYIPYWEAYKHLGNWRRADGADATWAGRKNDGVKKALHAALARLRRAHKPSLNDFMMLSNGLLGGIGGFYFQTGPPTFAQTEEVERKWREIFNRKFKRHRSTPRAELYQERPGRIARLHLWGVAQTAVLTAVSQAMADSSDTEQRAATRAMLALSFNRWGCRCDPAEWNFAHLRTALERSLRRSACRYIGDAWMLAVIEAREVERQERAEQDWHKAAYDWRNWTWLHEQQETDPLHAAAVHFSAPESQLLFQPTTEGGLGLEPMETLLEAGVVAVGHMCKWPMRNSGAEGAWVETYADARQRNPRLVRGAYAERQWAATRAELVRLTSEGNTAPTRPEEVEAADAGYDDGEPGHEESVDLGELETLAWRLNQERTEGSGITQAAWKAALLRCFPGTTPAAATEWEVGGTHGVDAAAGARIIFANDGSEEAQAQGGERRWMLREDSPCDERDDQLPYRLGGDGYLEGWQERAEELYASLRIDAEGYLCDAPMDGEKGWEEVWNHVISEGWGTGEVEEGEVEREEDEDEATSRASMAVGASDRHGAKSDVPRRRDRAQELRAARSRVGALQKLVAQADARAEDAEIEAAAVADEGEEPGVREARERSAQAEATKTEAEASRNAALREVRSRYLSDESGAGGTLPGLVQECQRCQETTAAAKVAARKAGEAAEELSVAWEMSEAGQAQRAAQRHRRESDRVRGLLQEAELKVADVDAEVAEEEAEQFAAEAAAEQEHGEAAWAGWEEDEEAERAEEDRMACESQDVVDTGASDQDAEMVEDVEAKAAAQTRGRETDAVEESAAAGTEDVAGAARELRAEEYTAAQMLAAKGRAWFSDAFLQRTTLGVTVVYERVKSGEWQAGYAIAESAMLWRVGVQGERGLYSLVRRRGGGADSTIGRYAGEEVVRAGANKDEREAGLRRVAEEDLTMAVEFADGSVIDGSKMALPGQLPIQMANDPKGCQLSANMHMSPEGDMMISGGRTVAALDTSGNEVQAELRWQYDAPGSVNYWPNVERRWYEGLGCPACAGCGGELARRWAGGNKIQCDGGCAKRWARDGCPFWRCERACDYDACEDCIRQQASSGVAEAGDATAEMEVGREVDATHDELRSGSRGTPATGSGGGGEHGSGCGGGDGDGSCNDDSSGSSGGDGASSYLSGLRITPGELEQRTVVEQMMGRARQALGQVRVRYGWKEKCKGESNPNKRKELHVNLHATIECCKTLITWWARVEPTAIYALDGSRKVVKQIEADGSVTRELRSARAAVRHDGRIISGVLDEEEGADNYLAELAAQLDALHAEPPGGRLIIVYDATSPVSALARFQRLHARGRQSCYVGRWFEAMERLAARHEVVVFIWQTSHVGATVNEWADKEADAAFEEGHLPIPRVPCGMASMKLPQVSKGVRRWASRLHAVATQKRLRATSVHTQYRNDGDMDVRLSDDMERVSRSICAKRYQGDDVRWSMAQGGKYTPLGCPHGCKDENGEPRPMTWQHVAFECQECEVRESREAWLETLQAADQAVSTAKRSKGFDDMHWRAKWKAVISRAAAAVAGVPEAAMEVGSRLEVSARRIVGGLVERTGDKQIDGDAKVKAATAEAITAGLRLQEAAAAAAEAQEEAAAKRAEAMRLLRKQVQAWRQLVVDGGPAKVAALTRIREARRKVCGVIHRRLMSGAIGSAEAVEASARVSQACRIEAVTADAAAEETSRQAPAVVRWGQAARFRAWKMLVDDKIREKGRKAAEEKGRREDDATHAARASLRAAPPERPRASTLEDVTAYALGERIVQQEEGRWQRKAGGEWRCGAWASRDPVTDAMRVDEFKYVKEGRNQWAAAARRVHARCGGAAGEEAQRKAQEKQREAARAAFMAAALGRWREGGTLSGAAAEAIQRFGHHDVTATEDETRRRARHSYAQRRKAKRTRAEKRAMAPVHGGHEADDSERWQLVEMVKAKRQRGGSEIRVLVRWADDGGKQGWKETWQATRGPQGERMLTADQERLVPRMLRTGRSGSQVERELNEEKTARDTKRKEREAPKAGGGSGGEAAQVAASRTAAIAERRAAQRQRRQEEAEPTEQAAPQNGPRPAARGVVRRRENEVAGYTVSAEDRMEAVESEIALLGLRAHADGRTCASCLQKYTALEGALCKLCSNRAGRRGLTATSIGGQGTVAPTVQDPFAFTAEAGAAGGAEKRVRPQEREDGGARAREVRMRRRAQADRAYARLRASGETAAGDEDAAGRRWADDASDSGGSDSGKSDSSRSDSGRSDSGGADNVEEMDAAAESEGEETRCAAGEARVRTETEEGGGSVNMECTWDAALRGEQVVEWVRGVCWGGEWAAGGDEATVADIHTEIQRRHGEVTWGELRSALRAAEEEGAVLIRGTTVHFI